MEAWQPHCISSLTAIVCSTEAMASGGKVTHFGRCFVSSHDGLDTKPSQQCLSREQAPSRLCEDFCKDLYLQSSLLPKAFTTTHRNLKKSVTSHKNHIRTFQLNHRET